MTQNSLYPGFVKLKYVSNGHTHYQVLPVLYDVTPDAGDEPIFQTRDLSVIGMNAAIDAYIAIIDNLFTDTGSFVIAENWAYPSVDSDPIFTYVYEIGQPGVSGTAPLTNGQLVVSFRTALGGFLKLYFMEQLGGLASKDEYPFANATVDALADYLINPALGWVVGRDGSHPISGLRALTKTNNALRKKYVLNT